MNHQMISPESLGLSAVERHSKVPVAFATWVRVLLQNGRQGTVGCKGRSDVAFSNKKPWKQKGTGRARAGSKRSPLWRGGGVIFGPQPRVRQLAIPRATKALVLRELLLTRLQQQQVVSLTFALAGDRPSTKAALAALKSAGLQQQQVTLLVTPNDQLIQRSFANLANVNLVLFDQLNAIELAASGALVCLEKDLANFKAVVSAWL